jgi:hypothetical protein
VKLVVAIPAYGGAIKNACVTSLMQLQASLHSRGFTADYGIIDAAGIAEVRNYYASMLLQSADHTHMLFVDNDMSFEPAIFWKLLDARKPLIGCIYPRRSGNQEFVVYNHGPIQTHNGLAKVEGIGMGLCLIQTSCFRALMNTGKIAQYAPHPYAARGLTGPLLGFFDPEPVNGEYSSEDFSFCRRWRTLCGGEVWALVSEQIGHVGERVYRGRPPNTDDAIIRRS